MPYCDVFQDFFIPLKEHKMTRSRNVFLFVQITFLASLVLSSPSLLRAAEVSGFVVNSSTQQYISDAAISVIASTGTKCNTTSVAFASVSTTDGSYSLELDPGNYFLRAHIVTGDYLGEWWAASASTHDCNSAEEVVVPSGNNDDINFQINRGASIGGTVYSRDTNSAMTGVEIDIDLYTGDPCSSPTFVTGIPDHAVSTSNGTYTLTALAPGNYFIYSDVIDDSLEEEWWDTPYSRNECSRATSVTVSEGETVTGKDFQLLNLLPEPGNIDMNGTIDLTDAILSLQLLIGQPSDRVWIEGDANLDDKIDLAETLFILNTVAGN